MKLNFHRYPNYCQDLRLANQPKVTIMSPKLEVFKILNLLATSFLLFHRQAGCSGVFELELSRFQQSNSTTPTTNKSNQPEPQDVMRIFVCLKEAFTTQLDGPCTFGNSSITFNKHVYRTDSTQNSTKTTADNDQESQLTNIVRILFTFRWTVSSRLENKYTSSSLPRTLLSTQTFFLVGFRKRLTLPAYHFSKETFSL